MLPYPVPCHLIACRLPTDDCLLPTDDDGSSD
jgi:hypothetical protein